MQAESVALLPSFYSEDTPASANETWARLHSDPLFAVSWARALSKCPSAIASSCVVLLSTVGE